MFENSVYDSHTEASGTPIGNDIGLEDSNLKDHLALLFPQLPCHD